MNALQFIADNFCCITVCVFIGVLVAGLIWCTCKAAGDADAEMERAMREYQERR